MLKSLYPIAGLLRPRPSLEQLSKAQSNGKFRERNTYLPCMRTWNCVRQNNALIGPSMVQALGPYWIPTSYNSKDISKLSDST